MLDACGSCSSKCFKKEKQVVKEEGGGNFPHPGEIWLGPGEKSSGLISSFNIIILLFPFSGRSSDKPQDGPGTENIYDVWYDIHPLDMQSVL